MVGTDVYSGQDKKLWSVNDNLVNRNGIWAVISSNGKKVAVPLKDFQFGNYSVYGHKKLVLPNMTQAYLDRQPVVHYNTKNYASNNGNGDVFGGDTAPANDWNR